VFSSRLQYYIIQKLLPHHEAIWDIHHILNLPPAVQLGVHGDRADVVAPQAELIVGSPRGVARRVHRHCLSPALEPLVGTYSTSVAPACADLFEWSKALIHSIPGSRIRGREGPGLAQAVAAPAADAARQRQPAPVVVAHRQLPEERVRGRPGAGRRLHHPPALRPARGAQPAGVRPGAADLNKLSMRRVALSMDIFTPTNNGLILA